MLVSRILGDCPECGGKRRFGNVMVSGDHVLRGCIDCKFSTSVWLPEIKKKIVYLDQFFFSSAFRERDERFTKAALRIRQIAAMQLLVAPFSSVHEDETHQWRGYDGKSKDDLMEFIKATSRGHEFEPSYDVQKTQIVRAFQAFLADRPASFTLEARDALEANVHEWDDYVRIDVGRYLGDIEQMRDLKTQSVEQLVDLFPIWRTSTDSFDQDIEREIRGGAQSLIATYARYASRLASGDYAALIDSPIAAMVVQTMLHCFQGDIPDEEKMPRIGAFFGSLSIRAQC